MKNVMFMEVQEWDKLVTDTYGKIYSLQQQSGCREPGLEVLTVPDTAQDWDYENDTVPEIVNGLEMGVSFAAWLARDPKQPLQDQEYSYALTLWWNHNFYPDIQMVANDLYARGLLAAGKYLIDIDW